MNSHEVIADAIAEYMPEHDEGQDGSLNLERAHKILGDLYRAGYAVVKPELGKLSEQWLASAQRYPEATRKFAADLLIAVAAAEKAGPA